jgi:hypothetical protein
MEVILDYHYMPLDFYNESQPKEKLFPRPLHSYVFQFNGAKGIYDSLRQDLEHAYKKKFVLTKGIKDSKYAVVKEFEWDFLTISPEVTVGIKTRYSPDGHYEVLTVRFMYDLPLGQMGLEMGNY